MDEGSARCAKVGSTTPASRKRRTVRRYRSRSTISVSSPSRAIGSVLQSDYSDAMRSHSEGAAAAASARTRASRVLHSLQIGPSLRGQRPTEALAGQVAAGRRARRRRVRRLAVRLRVRTQGRRLLVHVRHEPVGAERHARALAEGGGVADAVVPVRARVLHDPPVAARRRARTCAGSRCTPCARIEPGGSASSASSRSSGPA